MLFEFVLTSPMSHMSCSSNLDVFEMGGWWPYSYCFVGCCFQDLFNITCSILVLLLSSFFSICLVSIHVVNAYMECMDMTAAWKKLHFILSDSLSIAVHAFTNHVLVLFSIDEMLLPR